MNKRLTALAENSRSLKRTRELLQSVYLCRQEHVGAQEMITS